MEQDFGAAGSATGRVTQPAKGRQTRIAVRPRPAPRTRRIGRGRCTWAGGSRTIMEPSPLDNAVWYALDHPPHRVRRGRRDRPTVPAGRLGVRRRRALRRRRLARPGGAGGAGPARGAVPALASPSHRRAGPAWAGASGTRWCCASSPRSTSPTLDPSDPTTSPEMMALVELTRPGPFAARTVDLGGYVGVFDDGQLVAMAGERLRVPGCCEISAVCTRPDHRGRGLAAGLTALVARAVLARGRAAVPPPRVGQRPRAPGLRVARLRVPAGGRVRRVRRSLMTGRFRFAVRPPGTAPLHLAHR